MLKLESVNVGGFWKVIGFKEFIIKVMLIPILIPIQKSSPQEQFEFVSLSLSKTIYVYKALIVNLNRNNSHIYFGATNGIHILKSFNLFSNY